MSKALFVAGFAMGGLLLFGQDNKSRAVPSLVPVQTVITVETRHDHGKEVPSLSREDVRAYERQERLEVTDLVPLKGENAGLELFLLIDDASSMSLGSQLGDLKRFIEAQPASTSIGIGYMRNATVDMVQDLTTNHSRAAKALRLPLSSPGAMASPFLSLTDLIKRWQPTTNRREAVLITSGVDPLGGMGSMNAYLDRAIENAQRQGVIVYSLYTPGGGHARHSFWLLHWGQNHLSQISEETGGEAYMLGVGPPVSFEPYLEEITERLAHQYRATFLMKPETKGSLRRVRFVTEAPNAELVAPGMVYVPAAKDRQMR